MQETYKKFDVVLKVLDDTKKSFKIKDLKDIREFVCNEIQPEYPVETSFVIALSNTAEVIGYTLIGKGGINYTSFDNRSVFQFLLLANANAVVMVHNHTSGDPSPSEEDIFITDRFKKACALMGIRLLDHVIVSPLGGVYSILGEELIQ